MVVERLYTRARAGLPLVAQASVKLVVGQGIVGDRYFGRHEYPGQSLSLVAAEAIEDFLTLAGRPLDWTITARNLITRGVDLNQLIGREFSIGPVRLRGICHCDPCRRLGEQLAGPNLSRDEVIRFFLTRGGLRADVLSSGEIRAGDSIHD